MVPSPVWIDSQRRWNDSGYELEAQCSYAYKAEGQWIDWWIPASADGYDRCWLRPLGRLRRCPRAAWFQLIGCVNRRPDSRFLSAARARTLRQPPGDYGSMPTMRRSPTGTTKASCVSSLNPPPPSEPRPSTPSTAPAKGPTACPSALARCLSRHNGEPTVHSGAGVSQ